MIVILFDIMKDVSIVPVLTAFVIMLKEVFLGVVQYTTLVRLEQFP
jgi:hypothetical protein